MSKLPYLHAVNFAFAHFCRLLIVCKVRPKHRKCYCQ